MTTIHVGAIKKMRNYDNGGKSARIQGSNLKDAFTSRIVKVTNTGASFSFVDIARQG